ncbi:MAG TPA: hypothetical protein VHW66_24345 [Stellaceae bacterium]|jgi:hypothetical protein|nr:hypothetical protein [Stellaceae bacterium]
MAGFRHRPIQQAIGMHFIGKSTFLGIAFAAAAALGAQAAPLSGQVAAASPAASRTVLASTYNPYASGHSVCPQGAPYGGPKCHRLIPSSHPWIG